jgi:type IV secretion system protein VirB9
MQLLEGSEEIAPVLVFDDGRFTYFRFQASRELPSLFQVSPAGEETRVNFHIEEDLAVAQRTGRRFVLRQGRAAVGIWNDAFDASATAIQP